MKEKTNNMSLEITNEKIKMIITFEDVLVCVLGIVCGVITYYSLILIINTILLEISFYLGNFFVFI